MHKEAKWKQGYCQADETLHGLKFIFICKGGAKLQKLTLGAQFFSEEGVIDGEKDLTLNVVLMMQDYDFSGIDAPQDAQTLHHPSEQVVKNIIDFARSYETVEVAGVHFDLFLN